LTCPAFSTEIGGRLDRSLGGAEATVSVAVTEDVDVGMGVEVGVDDD
jgi:hypothetical protein